jgi:glutamyl-tRNA(Gln) amidotransferase subunit E
VFERVLPGPDRMYPDTDSPPIPLDDDYIEKIRLRLPQDVHERFRQLREWEVPEDAWFYLLRHNLMPLLERIIGELKLNARFVGTLFGHDLRRVEGIYPRQPEFDYARILDLLAFLKKRKVRVEYASAMLSEVYMHPRLDFDSVLEVLKFKAVSQSEILEKIPPLIRIAGRSGVSPERGARVRWIMGELRRSALGNMDLAELCRRVEEAVEESERGVKA